MTYEQKIEHATPYLQGARVRPSDIARMTHLVQTALGLDPDGKFGPRTQAALHAYDGTLPATGGELPAALDVVMDTHDLAVQVTVTKDENVFMVRVTDQT
tara:strand:+ start:2110 stop:2409 length:300 start_codon:yes stop_codon:yes gene_type:complete